MIELVALVGLAGSGKSTACGYFMDKGYKRVYFGSITLKELERRELEINPKNERIIREELRQKHGMAAYAKLSLKSIESLIEAKERVIIDGLYSLAEYNVLKDIYKDSFIVLAIFSPRARRYERLGKREVRPLTKAEALERDLSEIQNIDKAAPIALADYTIINDGDSASDMYERLTILSKKCDI